MDGKSSFSDFCVDSVGNLQFSKLHFFPFWFIQTQHVELPKNLAKDQSSNFMFITTEFLEISNYIYNLF